MPNVALFNGLSGLRAHSSMLNIVGNNIANENTTAFKSQRALFEDLVYQTLSAGSSPHGGLGGINPSQMGFGVRIGAVDNIFLQGPMTPTGRDLDAAIDGNGLFVVNTGSQNLYTRAGTFALDAAGYLVASSSGYRVQRFGVLGEPSGTNPGFQVPGDSSIRIPFGATLPGVATSNVTLTGNLSSTMAIGDTVPMGIQIFDTQGTPRALGLTFTKTAADTFTLSATISGGTVTVPAGNITFGTDGTLTGPMSIALALNGLPGAQTVNVQLGGIGGISQFGGVSTAAAIDQDGNSSGSLVSVSIDTSGVIQGAFSNGVQLELAQLAIANFPNSEGLNREGENFWSASPASGVPQTGSGGTGGRGLVKGGALEGSNVDLALELSYLIIAQRGFEANTRTISIANDMERSLSEIIR